MKLSPHVIYEEANKLRQERFGTRQKQLKARAQERFNQTEVEVPTAYNKTANDPRSNIINDEGRQVATLVYAEPTPHIAPPNPEDQKLTTKCEHFLIAAFAELEEQNGPVNWQCTSAQTHDNLGWTYFGPKKVMYAGAPTDDGSPDYFMKSTRYKRDAGIGAVFEYEHATTGTVFYDGNIYNPHCVYVWKEVPESTVRKLYGVYRTKDGGWSQADPEGTTSGETGYPADQGSRKEAMVPVIEYWDDEDCAIIVPSTVQTWMGLRKQTGGYLLQEWNHGVGRVPYYARPAFITEQLDEDKKFEGPLDGIHTEMPQHKRLLKMVDSVSFQTAFAPLKVTSSDQGETIMDDNGNPLEFIALKPGEARQLAPGQDVMPVGQSPEVRNLYTQMAQSQQTLQHYMLSPVAKGQSPGADTANAALTNLHQFQLSTLGPMTKQAARQWRAIYRTMLEQILELGETVYVLDRNTDSYLSLDPEDIVSVNVDAKIVPDQGQQQLLIEKHAADLYLSKVITLTQMYEMWGKENPEEFAEAVRAEQVFEQLWPVIMQQIIADYGMLDAVNAMTQANAEGGTARNAVPGLMDQARDLNGVLGKGSPGQPRTQGVRTSPRDYNTQQAQAAPVGGV